MIVHLVVVVDAFDDHVRPLVRHVRVLVVRRVARCKTEDVMCFDDIGAATRES